MELLQTEDGSHTLYAPLIDETYHSTHGAINESLHVFMRAGFEQTSKEDLRVLEVGFGTGLNAYLTALASVSKTVVHYASVEKYPLPQELWQSVNYPAMYGQDQSLFERLHTSPWNIETKLTPTFYLYKIEGDFSSLFLQEQFDLIFYDAFSPEKQPELWSESIFEKLYIHTKASGILTTYCAKGSVRRAMQHAGYEVERIPGPAGKREMLRAIKR
ncbi:MAG: tRNA (5-methylaminomethyl-2-thiouridine)(34)-methyltransferase MnmD [Paludibacteraceae bacterium]|nr:tRNA (5-methylaminomethyl-2-thiouridine)(34)-methyltransferase MnmD [Paludibacteraceae bacterium]